jgi:hypothetical protein
MQVEVGQEYIDKNGTIYRIDIIGSDGVVGYSLRDVDKGAYYYAGSAYIATFEAMILNGSLMPNTKTTKVLYGKD